MVIARPADPYPDPSWWGWGDPARIPALPEAARQLLRDGLGVGGPARRAGALEAVQLRPSRVGDDTLTELAAVVGAPNLTAQPEVRVRHSRGKSTPDLLRLRAGDAGSAPDLVV
ncbi:MAG: FAD-binding oxidoreductase, partial [Solirubrobacterales bacterium]|nr:FAD-binding oxidoreductase [Solirubrobacterales bacterium]